MVAFLSFLAALIAAVYLYRIGGKKVLIGCVITLILFVIIAQNISEKPIAPPPPAPVMSLEERKKPLEELIAIIKPDISTVELDRANQQRASGLLSDLSREYPDLPELKEWNKRLDQLDKQLKPLEAKKRVLDEKRKRQEMVEQRQAYAKIAEELLLNQGMDAYVTTGGKEKTTLTIKYVLCSRPMVHQLSRSSDFTGAIRSLGFKKVICQTGYGESYWITY